jgi:hypothetical protein
LQIIWKLYLESKYPAFYLASSKTHVSPKQTATTHTPTVGKPEKGDYVNDKA